MALAQIYTAVGGDTITAARWNNEFGNIYANGTDVGFPLTKAVSFAGFTITLDVSGVSTMVSSGSQGLNFTPGSKSGTPGANGSGFNVVANTFTDSNTAGSGTAALWAHVSVRTPTLAATNSLVTTTLAASLYVEGAPTAGANETISGPVAIYAGGMLATAAGSDIASAATIAVLAQFTVITGTTTITGISKTYPAGTKFQLKFTGAGLNLTHNGTSFISPYGRDYRTVANEIVEFISLGSGNYQFYSLNGPRERVGTTIAHNGSSAPDGYLLEDGSAVSRTTYAGLFGEIGTTHGIGDGATTFNIPDSRGRVDINVDAGANRITAASTNGGNADTLGGVGGTETHTLVDAELPSHTHGQNSFTTGAAGSAAQVAARNATGANIGTTDATGSDDPHSNTQPWIARLKYIRF